MLHSQISHLNKQAGHFFELAVSSDKLKEKMAATELARSLMQEARDIFHSTEQNTVLAYFEVCLQLKENPSHPSYMGFCARNKLPLLSQQDYTAIVLEIDKDFLNE